MAWQKKVRTLRRADKLVVEGKWLRDRFEALSQKRFDLGPQSCRRAAGWPSHRRKLNSVGMLTARSSAWTSYQHRQPFEGGGQNAARFLNGDSVRYMT